MKTHKQIKFRQRICIIKIGSYANNRTALQLVDAENGEPITTATVNIVAVSDDEFNKIASTVICEKDQLLFIKDWSENEGILQALVDQNIITDTGTFIPTGFVRANVCILQ